ncbi:MAG: hypothetical protein HC923_03890 [Myxococcales bacterium]|nr:hypothetical protein [Myxococcales bacterium]
MNELVIFGRSCNRCGSAVTIYGPDDVAFSGLYEFTGLATLYGLNFGVISDASRLIPLGCGWDCDCSSKPWLDGGCDRDDGYGPYGHFRAETPDRPSVDLAPREVFTWRSFIYARSESRGEDDFIRARTESPGFSELRWFTDVPTGRGGIEGPTFVAACAELGFEMRGQCRQKPNSREGVRRVTFTVPDAPPIVLETLEWTWQ